MNKFEAIKTIREAQSGEFKRPEVDDIPTGSMARSLWNESEFTYGMEYGFIYGLMLAFDIKKDEI